MEFKIYRHRATLSLAREEENAKGSKQRTAGAWSPIVKKFELATKL